MNSHRFFLVAASSILCLVTSCGAFSQPPVEGCIVGWSCSISSKRVPSHLHLFQSLLQKPKASDITASGSVINGGMSQSQAAPKSRISEQELSVLNKGFGVGNVPPFPYYFDLLPKDNDDDIVTNRATKMVVRHLEEEDIIRILPEVVREFGSLISSPQSKSTEPGDEVATQIENYLFSLTVLIGLTQRVKRRKRGYPIDNTKDAKSNSPDHNVICIAEQIPIISNDSTQTVKYSEQIVGIGEISWQPPNPNRNAPPYVLPFFVKRILAMFAPSGDENGAVLNTPQGYISNVLVYKNRRGLGYGRVLMAALEGIAKMWDCKDVRLHVDADENSGKVAQGLYRKLGYAGVPDRGSSKKKTRGNRVGYEWIGPSMANEGLYMVDGIPLLYMRKSLEE